MLKGENAEDGIEQIYFVIVKLYSRGIAKMQGIYVFNKKNEVIKIVFKKLSISTVLSF